MNQSLTAMFEIIADAAWRRRWLLILPIAIILPLGLLYAKLGPRTYVSKSLMLLQESGRDFPFSREVMASARMQDRMSGLIALLKSDRVLYSVMGDIAGDEAPRTPKEIAEWIRSFSNALSVELVGSDFLEFQLKSTNPAGLGKQLEAVTSRFLEALLSTDDALNATQVLLDRRRENLEAAERAYVQFKSRVSDRLPPTYRSDLLQVETLGRQLTEKKKNLALAAAELDSLRLQGGATLKTARARLATGTPDGKKSSSDDRNAGANAAEDPPLTSSQTALLAQLQQGEANYLALQAETEKLTKSVNNLRVIVAEYPAASHQLYELESAVQKAREDYQFYANRYSNQPTGVRAQGLLQAPERIKVIDAPRDPEFPATSAFKIAVGSAVFSLLMAIGLALAAELLDSRIRRPEQLEALTGVPVLARLS